MPPNRAIDSDALPALRRSAARARHRERSAAEIARVAKVNGGHKLGPDLRATN